MKKPLLDVLFMSEKRKNALLLLNDGPQEMEYLLKSLGTTRQALLPQIRVLEEHHLVTSDKDIYQLTTLGKLITKDMISLLDVVDFLDVNIEYWGTHKLDFMPQHLFERMDELKACTVIEIPLHEIFEENKQFTEGAKKSKAVYTVTSYSFPNFERILSELIANNVSISIIITEELFRKLFNEHFDNTQALIKSPNINLYMYSGSFDFLSFSINDYNMLLQLLTKDGNPDNKDVICSSKSALQWGKELFEYYLKDSKLITEL
ncbi:winged helix-turn-helix domain-containing protein [Methanolobus sp.]|uniref:helix-turn-helix transcriptional regulator n=1 Tax=Methanolobus sp. TaxID=1874737 RepID=UPI0025CCCAC0|nr:winged helix-turn-helix domain-containing protein [Methanolobus sp.]